MKENSVLFFICTILAFLVLEIVDAGPNFFIVNGKKAVKGQFPFTVLINEVCAGSLISPDYVLTAGHCVAYTNENGELAIFRFFFLQFGQIRMRNNPEWIYRDVDKVLLHEHYAPIEDEGSINDIALMKLNESVVYSKTIQAVQLPPKQIDDLESKIFSAIGWGITETGFASDFLLHVSVQGVTRSECQRILNETSLNHVQLHDGMLCATSHTQFPGGGICHGDSGGPLVLHSTNILVGLSSWGPESNNCRDKPHPDVYTRVSYYLDWIYSKVGEEYIKEHQNMTNDSDETMDAFFQDISIKK